MTCKAPPAVTDHPAEHWAQSWSGQQASWEMALRNGDVDAAWECWNTSAVQALGLQAGDRGALN
eukprot:3026269-Amphidinium_carterae.1